MTMIDYNSINIKAKLEKEWKLIFKEKNQLKKIFIIKILFLLKSYTRNIKFIFIYIVKTLYLYYFDVINTEIICVKF